MGHKASQEYVRNVALSAVHGSTATCYLECLFCPCQFSGTHPQPHLSLKRMFSKNLHAAIHPESLRLAFKGSTDEIRFAA